MTKVIFRLSTIFGMLTDQNSHEALDCHHGTCRRLRIYRLS